MNARILIADDEVNILKVLKELFKRSGFNVDIATDGEQAACMACDSLYDVVILDIRMPSLNGLQVLQKIKGQRKATIVIMMTAFGTINSAVEAMKLGAYDYITKPFENAELVTLVKQAITARIITDKKTDIEASFITGSSKNMQRVNELLKKIKDLDSTVLITGESGTGKSLAAKVLHNISSRKNHPFIHINCASLPSNLIESELFGFEKGAFTGALASKPGKFELAGKGTIFLDEISCLALELQAKLLTVLDERRIERLGSTKHVNIEARIVAATNTDLEEAVQRKAFREDLYYRLNVITLHLPPLREHKEDIPQLVQYFHERYMEKFNKSGLEIKDEVWQALKYYDWRGNIRELESTIESAIALTPQREIALTDLPARIRSSYKGQQTNMVLEKSLSSEEKEKLLIIETLKDNLGHRGKTAEELGVSRRTLQYKLKKYLII